MMYSYGGMDWVWMLWLFAGGFNALAKAIISDTTPKELKASAYGIYYGCVGTATFISLTMAGYIWDHYDAQVLFI